MKIRITSLQILKKRINEEGDSFYMIFDNKKTYESEVKIFFGFRGKMNKES
jgi:hypothetical protein